MAKLKFELAGEMVDVIGAGLGELPFKVAAPVAQELQRQINEQIAKRAERKKPKAPAE